MLDCVTSSATSATKFKVTVTKLYVSVATLGTLGASLLGNLLIGKGTIATTQGRGIIRGGEDTFRADEGTVRAGQDF